MHRILGISASSRVWGNCETSVKQVLAAAREEGARTGFVRLTDMDIQPCRGCFRCIREGGRCPVGDDLYAFLDMVREADDIVLASPVYFMCASAALTGLMDRLLTVSAYMKADTTPGQAVTITLMGNREWRGVAEPFVNLTASLLGFEIMDSLSLVAEGPGEIAARPEVAGRLTDLGRALARGEPPVAPERGGVCPVCRSDFFRVEPPLITCPVCGLEGDLETYARRGLFKAAGPPQRWGQLWLAGHIESWIRPSLERFVGNRREILRKLRSLKKRYHDKEERGN